MTAAQPPSIAGEQPVPATSFRWGARHTMLSVLFVTSIVSFMDRMVMSAAVPFIAKDFSLTSLESGVLMSVFFSGYAISQIPGGILADRFGVRRVSTLAMLWWSAFAALTGAAGNLVFMLIARFLFGLGEGVFPAAAFKAVAVWFPVKERATANAIKLASTPLGGALAPLLVVAVMSFGTWRTVFYILFVPGLIIAALFWLVVRDDPSKSPRVTREELALITAGDSAAVAKIEPTMGFLAALKEPGILRFFLVLFAFDIGYWGFTSWLPTYLMKARGFSTTQMGVAASLPFIAAAFGCFIGGWTSDRLFSKNRMIPIIASELLAAFLLYLSYISTSTLVLVVCQTLAGFFLNFFVSAFWALPMTTMPKSLMGVISGVINMAGQIAAFMAPIIVGYLVGAAAGSFAAAFGLIIGSILISCALVFTLPSQRKTVA